MSLGNSVDPELVPLWDQLGLSEDERSAEISRLNQLLQATREEPVESARNLRNELVSKINELRAKHIKLLECLGRPAEEIQKVQEQGKTGTFRARLKEVEDSYNEFEPIYNEKLNSLREIWSKIENLWDQLEYCAMEREECGTFDEIDISETQEKRYLEIHSSLEKKALLNKQNFCDLKAKIEKLAGELGETFDPEFKEFIDSLPVAPSAYGRAAEKLNEFTTMKQKRIAEITELSLEISHRWELLRTPKSEKEKFIADHALMSQQNIDEFRQEIARLEDLIVERLSDLIVQVRDDIKQICESLHNMDPMTAEVLALDTDDMETFKKLDSELLKMKQELIICEPILDSIGKRNEILKEYNQIMKERNPDKTQLDRIKRRKQVMLPKVEKKLVIQLMEYKRTKGEDFIWDGEILINQLSHVQLAATDLNSLKRAKVTRMKKPTNKSH